LSQQNSSSSSSTTGRRYNLWHFGSQGFSHVGSQAAGQQAPHSLALWHFRSLQALPQAGSQQAFSQHAFGQALAHGSGQQPFSQQPLWPHSSTQQPLASNISFRFPNKSRTGVARHFLHLPQPFSQAGSQQAFAQGFGHAFSQQAGAHGFGHAFSQQAGAHGFGHAFSQGAGQAFSQQATLAQALHSPQPPQFSPSMRSRSSKLNPWLHRATLTRSAPKIVLPFIEQPLLFSELWVGEGGSSPAVHTVYCARAVEPFLGPILIRPVA
jgi:hypothetical protein